MNTSLHLASRLASAICVACVLMMATNVYAVERAVSVRTHDLDLSTTRDARMLLRRLDHAAERVCDDTLAGFHPSARRAFLACSEAALERAVARIDAPLVHAEYALRFRRSGGES